MSDTAAAALEELLARYVEALETRGERLASTSLCAERPELRAPLDALIVLYERLERALTSDGGAAAGATLPVFDGYRTIERLGRGGSSEVYKLEDLTLGRQVAAKLLRPGGPLAARVSDFLREARSLALFEDPRIVRLLEYRGGERPVLLMELVDGFPLDEIGGSLEPVQQARVLNEVALALDRAHRLGLQHRDLKPGHILLDSRLRPKILDFGLARGEPDYGHGVGTPSYMAPEQLDEGRPIDARTDVYALGVILYELLAGEPPFVAETQSELITAIRAGEPRLPSEIRLVPEPLQAVALKAMARDPGDRYASASELAADLRRFAEGRPVLARPVSYRQALARRLRAQLEQVEDWQRQRLIYPHEGERLRASFGSLLAREDDWIVGSRVLSFSQITLYLGAFLLGCGSLLYLAAYLQGAIDGLLRPALALVIPFLGLSLVASRLYRGERQAVAVAFYLGSCVLLPLFIVVLLRENGLLLHGAGALELFDRVSNRQLQVALLASALWLATLAARTRTIGLASGFAAALVALHLSLLADLGLRSWLEQGRYDQIALRLVPLALLMGALGRSLETRASQFAPPLYLGGCCVGVLALELLALDGRALAHLGVTLTPLQAASVSDPHLLDTVVAMTVNGALIYLGGTLLERHGTELMRTPARLLLALSPFALLEPLAWLNKVGEYSRRFDWVYLALAIGIALLSRFRQRRSFYYAGLSNTALALYLITERYDWYGRPAWSLAVLAGGGLLLVLGFVLDARDRRPLPPG